jgi:hypothetical protein
MTEVLKNYQAFGLNVSSAIPLPDLPECGGPADASIRYGKITDAVADEKVGGRRVFENPGVKVRASQKAMYFDWARLGKVIIEGGEKVIVDPEPDTLVEDFHPFLTGPVLAVLLHQRGLFVLHASAVEIDGSVVAFLGSKGDGKSTLAACLKSRGHRLVSDDIVPVKFAADEVLTLPGAPRIKLFNDSIEAIGANPAQFPKIHRFVEKRSFRFFQPVSPAPVRLDAVYILTADDSINISRLNPVESFIEVIRNTHLNRYLEALNCQTEYFEFCRKFVASVPVFRLARPHDFEKIGRIGELLEKHRAEIGSSTMF